MAFPVCLELEVDGTKVEGTAVADGCDYAEEGAIACFTYSGGASGSATPGDQAGGSQSSLQPIQVSKLVDKTTPYLLEACCYGYPVTATFRFYHTVGKKGTVEEAYTVVIENARISSVSQMSADSRSNSPEVAMENISFVASQITVTWADGGVEIAWPEK